MRKQVFGRHLSRGRSARKALFRSLVRSLVEHGSIKTTEAKAKAIQIEIDRLMKLVRVNSVASKRSAMATLGNDKQTLENLFGKYSAAANQRTSGFTRITKLGARKGDSAQMVTLAMVDAASEITPKVKEKKVKPAKEVKVTKTEVKKSSVKAKKTVTKTTKKAGKK